MGKRELKDTAGLRGSERRLCRVGLYSSAVSLNSIYRIIAQITTRDDMKWDVDRHVQGRF
jgi:hypothetical protein